MNDCAVRIEPGQKTLRAPAGSLLSDILESGGYQVKSPCGGRGICGKCLVRVQGVLSSRTASEMEFCHGDEERLACQVRVEGDAEVHLPESGEKRHPLPHVGASNGPFAFAVDLGTTTIQISMVDMGSRRSIPVSVFLNPQRRYGHDIISRISASADPLTRRSLVEGLRRSVAASIEEAMRRAGITADRVSAIVLAGNTAMSYFYAGLDVLPLGSHPYSLGLRDFPPSPASILGLDFLGDVPASILPVASAFIGGDITGGLALLDVMNLKENLFFMDLGTNGEMFLRADGETIFAASCAMGPALEGMNISRGMTAETGAVTHINIGEGGYELEVLGGGEPLGISGTGIIDALAILLRQNILRKNGSFTASSPGGFSFHRRISVSQKDVRNIQLARGASLAAASLLLREARFDAGRVRQAAIAGALGLNLNMENFISLSFLPAFPGAAFNSMGNTSLAAAERACLDPGFIERAAMLRERIQVIELSALDDFNDVFMKSLDF